jgi:hypothetical protein
MNTNSDVPKKEGSAMTAPPDSTQENDLRSLTRLIVGALDIGIHELRDRLHSWEEELDRAQSTEKTRSSQASTDTIESQSEEPETESVTILRYALTGMVFDTQELIKSGMVKAVKVERRVHHRLSPIVQPLASSRLLSPARKRYRKLVSIGQQRLDLWIEIGRQEDAHSRMLAQTALTGTVDETVDYLAEMPGIQQLIATQTTSLAGEVIEEIRERTVGADTLLEGFARALFRRKPRYKLPPPPPAVQLSAVSLRAAKYDSSVSRKG